MNDMLFSGLRCWFESNWRKNFQYGQTEEILEKFKFDKMRDIYEAQKGMTPTEKENFFSKIRINIEILQDELKYKGIIRYTILHKKRLILKNIGLDIFYYQSDINEYTVFQNNIKFHMDEANLNLYIKLKTKEDLKKGIMMAKKTS